MQHAVYWLVIVALAAGNVICWTRHDDAPESPSGDKPAVTAKQADEPRPLPGWKTKKIEYQYAYRETILEPRRVEPEDQDSKLETPEDAACAAIACWYARDYEGWLDLWDSDARATFERESSEGRGADFYTGVWQRLLPGTHAYVVAKAEVEHANIVLIAYEVRRKGSATPIGERLADGDIKDDGRRNGTMTLTKTDEGWRQTNRYRDHPVKQMWWSGGERIKYVGKYDGGKGKSDG